MEFTTEIRLSETQESIVNRLLEENDPRVHPSTKAFFEMVRPEIAAEVADFYRRYQRMLFEMALALRYVVDRFEEEQTSAPQPEKGSGHSFYDLLHDAIVSVHPDLMKGQERIETILGALRGYADDGLSTDLDRLCVDGALRLVDTDSYGEEYFKQRQLETAS